MKDFLRRDVEVCIVGDSVHKLFMGRCRPGDSNSRHVLPHFSVHSKSEMEIPLGASSWLANGCFLSLSSCGLLGFVRLRRAVGRMWQRVSMLEP